MSHSPEDATYLGPDKLGNPQFTVESASTPGYWHLTTIFSDGVGGICTCQSYQQRGYCTMVDRARDLLILAARSNLVVDLLDLSAGILYNVMEDPDHVLDGPTTTRVRELELLADQFLGNELGGGSLGG